MKFISIHACGSCKDNWLCDYCTDDNVEKFCEQCYDTFCDSCPMQRCFGCEQFFCELCGCEGYACQLCDVWKCRSCCPCSFMECKDCHDLLCDDCARTGKRGDRAKCQHEPEQIVCLQCCEHQNIGEYESPDMGEL